MRARLLRFANELGESYWFVPTVMAIAALLLAGAMVWLDSHHMATWMDRLPWLYAARPSGARSLLSSIGGSMIGVAGTTFSVTIAAVVYASGQYGPRLLSNFMSDRGNQVTLGTFIATFLYSLIVLRTIRSPDDAAGEAAFVPQLAVLVGLLLVLCSIAVLIYFIHHVPSRIHINSVIERIGNRLLREIEHRFPDSIGHPSRQAKDRPGIPAAFTSAATPTMLHQRKCIPASETGYVQLIDTDALLEITSERDLIIRLQYQPGDFVHRGSTLIEAWPAERVDDDTIEALRDTFAAGSRRTALQDLRFLIDELVEIAARALSPGVNDPFTANSCLDWLGAALADLGGRDLPERLRVDDGGKPRVITHPVTFTGFVDRAFGALAQYASADMIAGQRFLAVVGDVALGCDAPDRLEKLASLTRQFRDLADEALMGANRDVVLRHADEMLHALAASDHKRRLRDRQACLGETA